MACLVTLMRLVKPAQVTTPVESLSGNKSYQYQHFDFPGDRMYLVVCSYGMKRSPVVYAISITLLVIIGLIAYKLYLNYAHANITNITEQKDSTVLEVPSEQILVSWLEEYRSFMIEKSKEQGSVAWRMRNEEPSCYTSYEVDSAVSESCTYQSNEISSDWVYSFQVVDGITVKSFGPKNNKHASAIIYVPITQRPNNQLDCITTDSFLNGYYSKNDTLICISGADMDVINYFLMQNKEFNF
jgi:hypothetical protein